MADEDFIINIQPTPNFVVELNEQGPQGPRGPQGVQGEKGEKGEKGDTGELSIGTVTTGDAGSQASVVNVGTSTDAILDFVIPRGPQGIQGIQGPPNELAIGTVEKGEDASATITGSYPDQKLNLVLPKGDKGDVGPAGTMPVGTIFPHTCSSTFVPENSLPCNGIEYSQTQFPALWTDWLVGGRLNTCTYSQYQSDIDTYGKCGKWALDTENGKFKTPYIPDGTHIQQAMTDGELGKSYNAGLPNITSGDLGYVRSGDNVDGSGALKNTGKGQFAEGANVNWPWSGTMNFDASRSNPIYGATDTVQTEAVSLRYFVVVATGSIKQSEMDWSQWVSSLQGKANVDMDNLSTAGKAEVAGLGFIADLKEDISGQVSMTNSPVLYTAERTGYVHVTGDNAQAGLFLNVYKPEATVVGGKIDISYLLNTQQFYLVSGSGNASLSVGVRKGQKYGIIRTSTNTVIAWCWFIPAEGVKE